jgi:hypothetical protein
MQWSLYLFIVYEIHSISSKSSPLASFSGSSASGVFLISEGESLVSGDDLASSTLAGASSSTT